jgi:hypothetical protein
MKRKKYSTLANPSEKTKAVLESLNRVSEAPKFCQQRLLAETIENLKIHLERVDFNTICVIDENDEWFHWSMGGYLFKPRASRFCEKRARMIINSLNKFNESRAKPFEALRV